MDPEQERRSSKDPPAHPVQKFNYSNKNFNVGRKKHSSGFINKSENFEIERLLPSSSSSISGVVTSSSSMSSSTSSSKKSIYIQGFTVTFILCLFIYLVVDRQSLFGGGDNTFSHYVTAPPAPSLLSPPKVPTDKQQPSSSAAASITTPAVIIEETSTDTSMTTSEKEGEEKVKDDSDNNSKELDGQDLISIIIPFDTYDEKVRNIIKQAIQSVLNQSYQNFEVIVIDMTTESNDDNNINDLSTSLPHHNDNSKIKFIKNDNDEYKQNHSYGLNLGIKNAKNEKSMYYAFLDINDVWLTHKLELQISFMKEHNIELSTTEAYYNNFNGDGCRKDDSKKQWDITSIEVNAKTNKLPLYLNGIYKNELTNIAYDEILDENGQIKLPEPYWNKKFIEWHNCFLTSNVIISKELYNRIDNNDNKIGFNINQNNNHGHSHYDYWLKIIQTNPQMNVGYISEPLTIYDQDKCRI